MAITYFGSASTPADNGTNITNPVVVTPPGSMLAGDLVFVTVCLATTSGTISVSQAGGQAWTALTQRNTSRNRACSFWCVFNGTWTANPSWAVSASNNIARMLVFRPGGGVGSTWGVDVAEVSATYTATATVAITGITTQTNGVLVIVGWTSADDNTWGSLTAGWTALTPAQVRNTSGSYDQSQTHAWMIKDSAGPTGDVSQTQLTLGNDAGTKIIMAFSGIDVWPPATAPAWPPAEIQSTWISASNLKVLVEELQRRGFTNAQPTPEETSGCFDHIRCVHGHTTTGRIFISPLGVRYPIAVCNDPIHKDVLVLWPPYYCGAGSADYEF